MHQTTPTNQPTNQPTNPPHSTPTQPTHQHTHPNKHHTTGEQEDLREVIDLLLLPHPQTRTHTPTHPTNQLINAPLYIYIYTPNQLYNELINQHRTNTGDQEDLREVIDLISGRYPGHPLFAVGYSAGSSLLGRYVGNRVSLYNI